jgi:hypothetical protein
MAQTYLTNLDLNKNQLLNAALQNLASDPSSPVAGQVYFNTTDNVFKIYDGTQWVDLQAGDISAVVAGVGLSGGGTSGSVTVDLADTAVTAGSYGSGTAIPVITVDAQGRITAASTSTLSTTLDIAADSGTDDGVALGTDTLTVSGGTGVETSVSGDAITVTLSDTSVSAGTYGAADTVPVVVVNGQGQATSVTDTTISIVATQVSDFTEAAQDVVGGQLVTNGSHTGLTAAYDDANDGAIDLSLANSGVTAASYGSATEIPAITVDAFGRVTAASTNTVAITSAEVTDFDEASQDAVAAAIAAGSHTGVTVTYDDANNTLSFASGVAAINGTANEVEVTSSGGTTTIGLPDDVTITNDLSVGNDLSVTGNLTVSGTTTTVNSTTVTVDDPIFTLGGDTAPASDDNKDRGIEFRWHDGSAAKVGFFGLDDSTGNFTFIPDATNSSEVFSGTQGGVDVNEYFIGGTSVLSSTTLGSTVTTSSLTAVGTISTGTWEATDVAVAHGGTGASDAATARDNLGDTASGLSGTTLARIVAADCAADSSGTSTTTVTHNFGTADVIVQVYDASTGATVVGDVVRSSTNAVAVTLLGTITAGDYRIVVTAA